MPIFRESRSGVGGEQPQQVLLPHAHALLLIPLPVELVQQLGEALPLLHHGGGAVLVYLHKGEVHGLALGADGHEGLAGDSLDGVLQLLVEKARPEILLLVHGFHGELPAPAHLVGQLTQRSTVTPWSTAR